MEFFRARSERKVHLVTGSTRALIFSAGLIADMEVDMVSSLC